MDAQVTVLWSQDIIADMTKCPKRVYVAILCEVIIH
jgi:hypothetical protein